jgi:hypothetical protein
MHYYSLIFGYECFAAVRPSSNVRLANQNGAGCGRVEVLHNGQWGTVCDDYWEDSDATVVCRQLGLRFSSSSCCAAYGQGVGMIWMDNLACVGTESSLESCSHIGWGNHDCSHSEDAGACCLGGCFTSAILNHVHNKNSVH